MFRINYPFYIEAPMFRLIPLLTMMVLVFSISPALGQDDSCTVILKNGNTIKANSCRIEGGRILLKYPVGEASFDLSQVKSVTGGGGSGYLQDKGNIGTPRPGIAARAAAPASSWGGRVQPGQDTAPQEDPKMLAEKQHNFEDFFDKYWQADEKTQEEMNKQMDSVFSDYFGMGEQVNK